MLTRAMSLSSLPAASPAVALTGGEGALLERARLGDRGAFEQLYRQHCAHIYALCLRLTGQRELAEDCVQETFIAAWRALHSFRQRSGYATWLHRIAVNTVLSLEHDITEWSTDIPAGDELDRAHASLRSLILELGRLSETGVRDPRQVVGPFVEALLALRDAARKDRRFSDADFVRERLVECGVEVRDTPDGSEWLLASEGTAGPEAGA